MKRIITAVAVAVAVAAVITLASGCKETSDSSLGHVAEVQDVPNCRIKVVPNEDRHGSPGRWINVECGTYKVGDKYPKE